MSEETWRRVDQIKPPEGVAIETKVDRDGVVGNETELVFDNPLWFFPDHSMYVYYTPTHWRPKTVQS